MVQPEDFHFYDGDIALLEATLALNVDHPVIGDRLQQVVARLRPLVESREAHYQISQRLAVLMERAERSVAAAQRTDLHLYDSAVADVVGEVTEDEAVVAA